MFKTYNTSKNLNSYGGKNKYSVAIGNTRNTIASSTRIFNYCNKTSNDPFFCMFGIKKPQPKPIPPDYLYYTFNCSYTPLTKEIIQSYIPLITIPGIFEIEPIIIINGTNVSVYIKIILIDVNSSNNFGITFNQTTGIIQYYEDFHNFYNFYTTNLTFINSNNCPLSKEGYQFAFLKNIEFTNTYNPLILPNTLLEACFLQCENFNSDISNWDTTNVINMQIMFGFATAFNQPIGSWNVSNVTAMSAMFALAESFNQPIGSWNVSNVDGMSYMFYMCTSFNQPIGSWNVSNVTSMISMFYGCTYFNQSISGWNTSSVTEMDSMFSGASSFNNGVLLGDDSPLNWNVSETIYNQALINGIFQFNLGSGIKNSNTTAFYNLNSVLLGVDNP